MSIREPIVLVLQENQAGGGSPGTTQQAPDTAAGLEPMEQGGEGQAGPQSLFSSLMPLLVIGLIFYVLLIGPERKNRKKQEVMRKDLKKGDEVMTTGGRFGRGHGNGRGEGHPPDRRWRTGEVPTPGHPGPGRRGARGRKDRAREELRAQQ